MVDECNLGEDIVNDKVWRLSGGEFEGVWIGKGLILEGEIVILDEGRRNLDVINEEGIVEMLIWLKMRELMII
ncbi:P-loop NTPase family protein [Staphylococcus epidermidis]|uniref:hypothetical protein n=1 Tax=Staphylococcus epidermidis TaxID=1282 RepID=UPI0011A64114|nr:hypothetical protein [Staphylococcus epidermidis]